MKLLEKSKKNDKLKMRLQAINLDNRQVDHMKNKASLR